VKFVLDDRGQGENLGIAGEGRRITEAAGHGSRVARRKPRTSPSTNDVHWQQWEEEGTAFRLPENLARIFVGLSRLHLCGRFCKWMRSKIFSSDRFWMLGTHNH
jgi:hypothetical protein